MSLANIHLPSSSVAGAGRCLVVHAPLGLTQTMQTDFLSIRVMIVSSITLGTFLMHRIRNVLTNRVLKKSLGDHGTWLPIRPAVTYVYTLPLPSVAEHRAQPIA